MTDKDHKLAKFFMKSAILASENSYAVRAKVGAVLVMDGRIIASGWNGTVRGQSNICECIAEDGTLKTLNTVIHAEQNIISFCAKNGIGTDDTTIYITLSPCSTCALLLIQAGISRVVYLEDYRDSSGLEILHQSNIKIEHFPMEALK